MKQIGVEIELAVFRGRLPIVCDFLPYQKNDPLDISGSLFHKDASMLEIAMAPVSTPSEFNTLAAEVMGQARGLIPAGTYLLPRPRVEYTEAELAKDEYASVLGCHASDNLYSGQVRMPEEYPDTSRYGGVHLNLDDSWLEGGWGVLDVLKLDAGVGLHAVMNHEQAYAEDIRTRRKFYGRAGEHRFKPFGIEYRTLSAASWPHLTGNVLFDMVDNALALDIEVLKPVAKDIEAAINQCDLKAATELVDHIQPQVIAA